MKVFFKQQILKIEKIDGKIDIEKFDNDLKKLKTQRKESLLEIWNMAKERIKRINKLLNKEILTVIYTDRKPLLVLENELFIKKDTKIYVTISSLTKEIKSLIQDEIMMFQEFKKHINWKKRILMNKYTIPFILQLL